LPVEVVRDYRVPGLTIEGTLVIAVSFSGNTEETLNVARYAGVPRENLVVITSGGALADLAERNKHPMIQIPVDRKWQSLQPRCATGYIATYLARLLEAAGALSPVEDDFRSLVAFLRALDLRAEGEALARWIGSRIPVFYADNQYVRSVARVARIKFNENAKMPAFFGALPEVNHNEMIGFSRPVGKFAVIYFRDPDGDPRIDRRYETMRALFEEKKLKHVSFREWAMPGRSPLKKIFAALALTDWASHCAALLAKTDPTPVSLVEEFKVRLRSESAWESVTEWYRSRTETATVVKLLINAMREQSDPCA
jgi:glucose/mannose-6-phosphate isomerase